jgi:adenylate cyclase class 2
MGVEYDWIRLRHNGKNTTLAHKKKTGQDISETEEIEVIVDDFDKTAEILSKIGFKNSYYQENKRHFFKLNAIEFCIDTWPKIPSHLEVESFSEEKVLEGLRLLGLEGKDSGNLSIKDIYLKYGIDLHSFNAIKFDL